VSNVEDMRAVWKQAREGKVASRLDSKLRSRINRYLSQDKRTNGNHPNRKAQDGYAAALDILARFGIQIDMVVNNFQFESGLQGTLRVELAFGTEDPFSPDPIANSLLLVGWAPFGDTGSSGDRTQTKFETVAYLT
jgi:hypothetical protein